MAFELAAEQRRGRAAVLGVGVPRAAGEACGYEVVTVSLEDRFGHEWGG